MKTATKSKSGDDYLQKMLKDLEQLHEAEINDVGESHIDEVEELLNEEAGHLKKAKTAGFPDDRVERGSDKKTRKVIGRDAGVGNSKSALKPGESSQETLLKSSTTTTKWHQQVREILRVGVVPPKDMVSLMHKTTKKLKADLSKREYRLHSYCHRQKIGAWHPNHAQWTRYAYGLSIATANRFHQSFLDPIRRHEMWTWPSQEKPILEAFRPSSLVEIMDKSGNISGANLARVLAFVVTSDGHFGGNPLVKGTRAGQTLFKAIDLSQLNQMPRWSRMHPAFVLVEEELDTLGYVVKLLAPAQLASTPRELVVLYYSPEYVLAEFGPDSLTAEDRAWLRKKDIHVDAK